MHTSAFGVEHWESQEIYKAGSSAQSHNERAEGYRKTKNTLAGIGGVAGGLGAATGAISAAEYKGKDPVGLSLSGEPGASRKYTPTQRKKFLRINAKAHGKQTVAAAGISAASLGLAGAYKHAEKKERLKNFGKKLDPDTIKYGAIGTGAALAGGAAGVGAVAAHNKSKGRKWNDGGPRRKAGTFWEGSPLDKNKAKGASIKKADTKRKVRDAATDTATVGLGAGAVGAGAYNTNYLAPAAKEWGNYSRYAHGALKGEKKGKWSLDAKQKKYYKKARVHAARTAGIKGAGVAASLGVAGLGGKAIYDVGSRNVKEHK